ncbi:MAG: D-ribose pyranase [Ruminococcaceae bacterium]|nr:D-ribose pyranase [Oscillospiraceae bacterium]
MKKSTLLNAPASALVAEMGHTDMLTICDCGLPISDGPKRIDLALTFGTPTLPQTLETVLSELKIEGAILASEIIDVSPEMYKSILELLGDVKIEYVSHEDFKKLTQSSRGIIRTGECTSFANVILISGVAF